MQQIKLGYRDKFCHPSDFQYSCKAANQYCYRDVLLVTVPLLNVGAIQFLGQNADPSSSDRSC